MIRSFFDRVLRQPGPSVRRSSSDFKARRAMLGREVVRLSSFEQLEERRVLAYGAILPGVFIGDGASDHLVLEAGVGGNLRHNLPTSDPYIVVGGVTAVNPAFAPLFAAGLVFESDYDADGSVPGVQLFSGPALSVTNAGGDDIIEMIGIGAATVTGSAGGNETLRIHGSGGNDVFTVTPVSVNAIAIAALNLIEILGSGGDDFVTLSGSTVALRFEGGAGDDTLSVIALSAGGADFEGGTGVDDIQISPALIGALTTYEPGVGLTIDAQTINFAAIEEIVDLATTATLQVNADGGANAITFAGGAQNSLSVDGHELYKFAAKGAVLLDAGAGADTVDLVFSPVSPAPVTIDVAGGDSDQDQLFVTGSRPVDIGLNVGTSTITGAAFFPGIITYDGFEGLTIARGSATGLSVSGSTTYEVEFGGQADAGTIQTDALPVHFAGFDTTRKITLSGATITVHGTSGDDTIELAANPGEVRVAGRPIVVPTGYSDVVVDGLDGDDTFAVTSTDAAFVSALVLQGGSGSDTINWNSTAIVTTDVDLAFEQIQLLQNITTSGGDVTLRGATTLVGNRTINSAGGDVTFQSTVDGASDLTVTAGGGDVRFLDDVGAGTPLGRLTVSNSGELLLAGDLHTTSSIDFANATGSTRLADDIVISTTGGGLEFGAAVNATSFGVESLTVDIGEGGVRLRGVGTDTALGTFRVARASTIRPGGMIVTAGGSTIDLGGGTLIIDVAGLTLDATGGGLNPEGADVILADVAADSSANNRDLTILAGTTGRALLTGAIGTTRLDGLTITADGGTEVSGDITAGNGGEAVTFNSPVRLLASIAIDSGNGDSDGAVVFNSTVDGPYDLTIDANSDFVLFHGAVGSSSRLGDGSGAALTIVRAAADVTFEGTVALASGLSSLDGATGVTFLENIDLLAGDTGTTIQGDQITLSGLRFQSAGAITFGDAASDAVSLADGAVEISTAAGNATLAVNATVDGGQDLTIAAGSGAATFVAPVGGITPLGDGVGAALTLTSGFVTFQDTVETTNGIIAGDETTILFESNVTISGGSEATSLDGNVTLDGLTFLTFGAVNFGSDLADQILLTTDAVTITTNGLGANLIVRGKVDGDQDLTLNVAGASLFAAPVGSQLPIGDGAGAAVTINSDGSTTFDSTLATASGLVQSDAAGVLTFADNVFVGDGDTNTALDADVILDGAVVTADDPIRFGGDENDLLWITGMSWLLSSGDLIEINSQTILAADLLIDAGAGDITINGAVDGNNALVLFSSGTTTINAALGSVFPIRSLTTDSPGTTQLNASITAQGNTLTFNDPVVLLSSVTLTDSGNVTFNSTVDGPFDLTLNVTGTTRFVAAVGSVDPLGDGAGPAIAINSTGPTIFDSTIATESGIVQAETAGSVTLRDDLALAAGDTPSSFAGSLILDGLTITSSGPLNLGSDETDMITLSQGPVTIVTVNQPLTVNGKVNGSQDLTVSAGASSITFHASLGDTQRIGDGGGAALTITSATAGVTFHGVVNLASGLSSLDDLTGVTFRENVDLLAGHTGTTINANQLTLRGLDFASAGPITLGNAATDTVTLSDGAVGISTVAGDATLTINATVQGAQDLAITAGTGQATFNAAVGNVIALGDGVGAAITLVSGTVSFESTVRTSSGLVAGEVTDVTFRQDLTLGAGDTASSLLGDVTLDGLTIISDGAIALGDADTDQITLSSGAVAITTSGVGDNFVVAGRVDGAQDLTLSVAGSTLFSRALGSATPLGDGAGAALIVNSTGSTTFAATLATRSGLTQADAAGLVTFAENVSLGDGDTNTTLNANIVFDGLTFAADDPVTIGSAGTDTLLIAGATVLRTSNDLITINSATALAANLIIDAGGGNIVLNGTVNGNWSLVLNSSGTTTINGVIGGVTPIASLTTDAPGTTQLNANVTAQGHSMTYNDPVTLLSSLTLTDVGDVTFNSTLNGSFDLTLVVGGTTRFVGAVGAVAALGDGTGAAISIHSTGPTIFESTSRTASGITQAEHAGLLTLRGDAIWGAGNTDTTLNGSVVLDGLTITAARAVNFGSDETDLITLSGGPVAVTTAAANVAQTYHGKVNGSQDLTVSAGASSITFHASLGDTQRIGDGGGAALTITGATAGVNFHGVVNLASGLSSLDDLTGVTFRENVDLLAGDTGTTINANALRLNGLAITSAGNVTLTDDTTDILTLDEAQVTLTTAAAGTNITVNGLVRSNDDAESTLVVDAGHGNVAFRAAIGDLAANSLAALSIEARNIELRQLGAAGIEGVAGTTTVTAANVVTFTGTIYTANQQTYVAEQTFDLTAGLPTTFTSSADAITFATGAIVLANGSDLAINSTGGTISTGAIRGTSSEDVAINAGSGEASVGEIGNGDGINTVSIIASRITLNGNITTSNSAGNTVTLTGAVELAAAVFINTNTIGVDGSVTISGPGTVDGAHDFRIDAGAATITIAGTIGAAVSTPLDSLDLDAATINLASIGTPTEAGVINTTDVNATSALNFTGSVYHTNLAIYTGPAGLNLNVNAGAPTSFITSDDPLTFATATVELANGSDLIVTTDGGAVSILAGIDGTSHEDVTISSTGGTVNRVSVGQIGTTTANGINTVTISAGEVRLSGNITTSNAGGNHVTITGATELDTNIVITTNNAASDGNVTFNGTVNGPFALSVSAGVDGDVKFTAGVGGVTPLSSLTVSDSNETSLAGAVTDGAQSYTSDAGFFVRGTFLTLAANVTFSATSTLGDVTLVDDTLISTGSSGGDIGFGANVDINGLVEGRETLSLNAGSGNITLQTVGITTPLESLRLLSANNASIISPVAGTTYLVADIAADAESTSADNLLAVSFRNVTGTVTVTGSATGSDAFVLIGAKSNDVVTVTGTSVVANGQLFALVAFSGDGQANSVTIHGFDGDDTITVTPAVNLIVAVNGGNPSQGSDVLNFLTAVGSTTVNLGNSSIDDTGVGAGPDVFYTGIETINLNAGGVSPTVAATANDDDLTITPYSADTGKIERGFAAQQSGQTGSTVAPPVVFYSNLGAGNAVVLDGLGGHDTVVVQGNASAQTFDVNLPAGSVSVDNASNGVGNDGFIRYTNNESLALFGLEGNDSFNIATWTTAPVVGEQRIPVMVDGGAPIGIIPGAVDTINISASGTAVIAPGPEADAGGILVTNNAPISFDQIEALSIFDAGGPADLAVVIQGTNGDDDITLQGVATNSYTVSVNEGPAVLVVGSNAVTLNGLSGDDDIDVDVDVPALSVAITVHGNLPVASGGDILTVTGIDGAAGDAPTFTPTGADSGTFVVAGTTITFSTTELVVYDGESDNETLTVNGAAGIDDVFHYTPDSVADAGSVQVSTPTATRVPLRFAHLGATGVLNLAGDSGNDTILQQGTNLNDVFTVAGGSGTINHVSPSGLVTVIDHVDVTPTSVENLVIATLDGDDTINLNGAPGSTPAAVHPYSTISVQGGEPSASDTLNINGTAAAEAVVVNLEPKTITGLGGVINYDGVEHVQLDTNSGGDTLTVNGTSLDDEITYTPTGATSGQFFRVGENVGFAFVDVDSTFSITGGAGESADQVNVIGTNSRDTITIDANTRVAQVVSLGTSAYKAVTLASTVDVVSVFGRNGQDTFIVVPLLGLLAQPSLDNLAIYVDGGQPGPSDALVIAATTAGAALPAADFVVVSRSLLANAGSIRVFQDQPGAGNNPFQLPDISYTEIEVVSPNVATTANGDPNLLVLGADANEPNEFRANATFLGSGSVVQSLHASILPPAGEHPAVPSDQDFYRIVAEKNGILDFQVFFNQYSSELLPSGGDLSIEVRDATGDLISTMFGGATVGNNDASSIEDAGFVRAAERVRFPAVAGQTYYLRVFGRNTAAANDTYAAANTVLNGYDLQVINSEPSVPYDLELNDIVQVGTVTVGTSSTQFTATLAPVNGVLPPTSFDFVGKTVEFTSGPNVGRFATISAFNSGTGVFTVTNSGSGLIATPAVGNTFLIETTDTGRSQLDNVTRDNTPIITFRLDDGLFLHDLPGNPSNGTPPDEVVPIPFNTLTGAAPVAGAGYRVAIYDEGAPQQAGVAPQTPIGYARPLAGVEGVYTFDFGTDAIGAPLVLSNGSHFLSAKVEIIDPATPTTFAYGARSQSLEIVVDAVTPPVSFGDPAVSDDGLHPDSDSGDPSIPATLSDNVTNDTTPTFFGRAEADSVVRLYIDLTNNGFTPDDLLLGQTVASPGDGTNQHPFGEWQVTSTINMNDPVLVPTLGFDGIRNVFVTAEDPSGNISPIAAANTLQIFVDTTGPQVTGVFITSVPTYNLFSLKPGNVNQGPTPAVNSLTINIRDLPARQLGFLYQAISNVPPLAAVVLRGDHSGIIPIASITFTSDGNLADNNPPVAPEPDPLLAGNPAFGYITLTFSSPLPDDRFTLTLHDNIIDPVGNQLDGENNAAEPVANPTFPTGDDIPGGDFIARFTVDSRPEVATWSQGIVYVDINGNLTWDPEGQDNDYTNRDFIYNFGNITDAYFAGNFAPAAAVKASGFDKIGSYGAWNGVYQFFLDTNDDGVQDFVSNMPAAYQVNGIPVAGNFSVAHPGDEIGLYDGTAWYLDVNGNNVIDVGERFATILRGIPLVGDFNGDGNDDLAVYHNDTGVFDFDLNRDHVTIEDRVVFGFSGFGERPVTGDVNLDGVDDLVLWVPGREGQLPKESGEFHFLVSDDTIAGVNPSSTRVRNVFAIEPGFNLASAEPAPAAFSPAPLGNDLVALFGDDFALPILGNFDPPVGDIIVDAPTGESLTNPHNPLDVDGDGVVAPIDSLLVLNRLNQGAVDTSGPAIRTLATLNGWMMDTSGDRQVSPIDSLLVINYLNAQAGVGEGEAPAAAWRSAVDALFADELLIDEIAN